MAITACAWRAGSCELFCGDSIVIQKLGQVATCPMCRAPLAPSSRCQSRVRGRAARGTDHAIAGAAHAVGRENSAGADTNMGMRPWGWTSQLGTLR